MERHSYNNYSYPKSIAKKGKKIQLKNSIIFCAINERKGWSWQIQQEKKRKKKKKT